MEALGHVYPSQVPGWVGEELVATYGRFQLRAPLEQFRGRIVKKTQYVLYLVRRDGTMRPLRTISDHRCSQADILDAVRGILRARIEVLQNAKHSRDQLTSGKARQGSPPPELHEYDEELRKAEIEYKETLFAVAEFEEASAAALNEGVERNHSG